MTDPMIGHVVRTLRVRHGWRQVDLARRARVSPATVARIERGQLGEIALDRLRRVLVALGGRMDVIARWGAGDLDRLLGARHAAMHELMARGAAAVAWARGGLSRGGPGAGPRRRR